MAQEHRALKAAALVAGLVATLLLTGCPAPAPRPTPGDLSSGSQPPGVEASPQQPIPPPAPAPRPAPPPRENKLSPATRSLVTQSQGQLSRGDMDGASSTLDRALRIEPNNPLLWIELGRLRLVESEARQAEGCGRKALSLASGDKAAQKQAGRLLVDALRAQQRNQEAHAVETQPYMR